tara:strand:+ start:8086 stop:9045 length:960 start_codon:yes stop_codon:yes gene_type:complete
MKSFIRKWLFVAILPLSLNALACDLCNLYLSINPNDFQHSIAVNYRYRSQSSFLLAGPQFRVLHTGSGYLYSDTDAQERFQTIDVWGNFFPVRRVQLSINVPVTQHQLFYNGDEQYSISGVGDITLLGMYQIHNTTCDTVNDFRQRISVGGGIKLPTGAYKAADEDGNMYDPHMQVGTGSVDGIAAVDYMARYKRLGLSTNISYRMSSTNPAGYAFANRLNWTLHFFYQIPLLNQSLTLMPKAGFYHEQAEQDLDNNELVEDSGGKVWFGSFGGMLFWKKFSLNFAYQPPLKEELNGAQFPNDNRYVVGLNWYIPSRFN